MPSSKIVRSQPLATKDDVAACYRFFLDREPESYAAMLRHLEDRPGLWDLVGRFYASAEANRRRVQQACALIAEQQSGAEIDVEADPECAARLTAHIAETWSRYGRTEAFFSVLTNPRYLQEQLQVEDVEEFYNTGCGERVTFERCLHRNGVTPKQAWTLLELGCGVGRIAEPMARRFAAYVGVDISAEHLALARARMQQRSVDNVTWLELPNFMAGDTAYDVFFSVIVLQHNPPPIMRQLLDLALGCLRPGGVAYFQLPCHLYDYSFRTEAYLAGEGRSEQMEMHALPQREVFSLFSKHGFTPLEVSPDDRVGPLGFSYTFLALKAA